MQIGLYPLDAQQIREQLQAELAKPEEQQDEALVLRLAAQLYAAKSGLPELAAVPVPWGGVTAAVRALCEGQRSQPGALSVLAMDPARSEAACGRIDKMRDTLGVVLGLAEPLRGALATEASALQGEAKDRYDTVRSLTRLPAVAAVLQPATDHFYGPSARAVSTRAAVKRGADRVRGEEKPQNDPQPQDDSLLTLAPPAGRRRTRRG